MTAPLPGTVDRSITQAVRRMRDKAILRDEAIDRVRKVRAGDLEQVLPGVFSERYPKAMVANFVDIAARDLAANLAPLPSLTCSAGNMKTDADKRRAERKNRIGANYWRESRLQTQMMWGSDQYLTYGFLPVWVEPDFERQLPIIHVEDPNGAYYELDRWFRCKRYARVWRQDTQELASLFPEYAGGILVDPKTGQPFADTDTEVVRYIDDKETLLYLSERRNLILARYKHGMGKAPVHIALRPGVSLDPRGQFDDVLWVQIAHAVMTQLTIEAGHKAVQAPLAVPSDVNELPVGADAVIVTDNPEKIQRVPLQVPPAAFALNQQIQQEMHTGAGYPDTRLGVGPAGGSTGRGISALEGGFDTQIRLGQSILGECLRISTDMCFEMELKLWPNRTKTVSGTLSGESYTLTYRPSKDLAGDTRCDVSYGFASGLSPNQAIVTLLQLRGDGIIGRDTFRRQLPFDVDVDQQQRELDVQLIEDGLKQGLAAGLQAVGQMVAQGQTELAMQFFTAATQIIQGRRQGQDLSELFVQAFQPPAPPPGMEEAGETTPDAETGPGEGPGPMAGVGANGLPTNVAPGQAGLPPGGRPSIMDLTAGFTGGGNRPNMNANIRRRIATG